MWNNGINHVCMFLRFLKYQVEIIDGIAHDLRI